MTTSRLQNRADIITYIYQSELLKYNLSSDQAFESGDYDNNQLKKIEAIAKNYDKFKKIVIKYLKKGWTWGRIDPLERAILIYGAFEMSHLDKALVINEMIILTKGYIPGNNYKYINSILDKVGDYYEKIKKS